MIRFQTILLLAFLTLSSLILSSQSLPDTTSYPYWIEMMNDPSSNFFKTQSAFEKYWQNRQITRGCGFKPFKRWEYINSFSVKADGIIPSPSKRLEAYEEFMSKDTTLRGNWTSLGPHEVPSGYNGYRGLGRINSIAFHPTDTNTMYIGAPSGGFWKTTNHGNTWETSTDILQTLGVSAIVVDFTNPNIIYIGTGDRDANDATGLGVWKSIDGGNSWMKSNQGMGDVTVNRMVINSDSANVIVAATSNGIYKTTNSGVSWDKKATGNFKDLVHAPGNNGIIYATANGNFYKSINYGESFFIKQDGLTPAYRGVIGVSPADPSVVYFLTTNQADYKAIYKSTNFGETFDMRSNSPNIMSWDCDGNGSGGQAWYDLDIAVDPQDPNIVLAGGVNCFKSIDGGITWQITSHWWGDCEVQAVHADLHVFEYSPINNRLFVGNDGGLYWTDNDGFTWTEISNGLTISQTYKMGQSRTNKNLVINGYQDNGTSTYTGEYWIPVNGGDGMECAVDPNDDRYTYSTVYYGKISRHFNNDGDYIIAGENVNGINESGNWVTPFIIDHNDGNTMFIGYKNIWRSNNIKANIASQVKWKKISNFYEKHNVLRQSYKNTNIIYASAKNTLNRTDNAKDEEVTWKKIKVPTNLIITAIETDHKNENIVYIAMQNNIFVSQNKGETWDNITLNLPSEITIYSIANYANSRDGLYLGTNIGAFYKDSKMSEWISYSGGFPTAGRITEIEIFYDTTSAENDLLRAATYGRGLWESQPYCSKPQADFFASSNSTTTGCKLNFFDNSYGTPYSYKWTFTGATTETSTAKNPTDITWITPGEYNVKLVVANIMGSDSIVKEKLIKVNMGIAPTVKFNANNNIVCSNKAQIISFYDESENCPTNWEWSFEPNNVEYINGTNAHSQNPTIKTNGNTNYNVTLKVSNPNGSNTLTKPNFIIFGGVAATFEENFESYASNNRGWEIVNPDNSTTWNLTEITNNNGTKNNAMYINFFNYNGTAGRRDDLISPPINLKGLSNAFLKFNHAYCRRYNTVTDSLIVYVSDDCGETWKRVAGFGENGENNFVTAPLSTEPFIPTTEGNWCYGNYNNCNLINISEFIGKENVKIKFQSFFRRGNNLYIDNILVGENIDVNEMESKKVLNIFPNPSNGSFIIQVDKNLVNVNVKIYGATGNILYNNDLHSGNNWKIESKIKSKGVYVLKLTSQNETIQQKIIIK